MRKQRKMEYESPQVAEIEILADFMQQVDASLKDMNKTYEGDDFWSENN